MQNTNLNNMKVIILCGGKGQRISSETVKKPKPLIKIGKIPIIEHILKIFLKNNFNNFYLLVGYKGYKFKKYFEKKKKYNVKIINTGLNTGTAARLKFIKKFLKKNENFMMTYGDGVTNQNLEKLKSFHIKKKRICTMTIVRPPARFGEVTIKNDFVSNFKEKRQVSSGWINGGYMVLNQKIFKYISNKKSEMLEQKPLEKISKLKNISAFKHLGFWQCMDTLREKEYLDELCKKGKSPWLD